MVAKWSKLSSGYFLGVGAMEVGIKSSPLQKAPLEIIQATYDVSFSPSIEIALQI
jgi:hypothetical protein